MTVSTQFFKSSPPLATLFSQVQRRSAILLAVASTIFIFHAVARADAGVPIPAGTWTLALTRGLPVEVNGWEQLVYAPILKQSIMFSQYHQRNSEPNESMLGYNFETNSWGLLDMGGNFH